MLTETHGHPFFPPFQLTWKQTFLNLRRQHSQQFLVDHPSLCSGWNGTIKSPWLVKRSSIQWYIVAISVINRFWCMVEWFRANISFVWSALARSPLRIAPVVRRKWCGWNNRVSVQFSCAHMAGVAMGTQDAEGRICHRWVLRFLMITVQCI